MSTVQIPSPAPQPQDPSLRDLVDAIKAQTPTLPPLPSAMQVLQTLAVAGALGMGGWVGLGLVEVKENQAVMQTEIRYISKALELGTEKRYTSEQAQADFAVRDGRLDRYSDRLTRVEDIQSSRSSVIYEAQRQQAQDKGNPQ